MRIALGHRQQRHEDVAGADAAVGTDGDRRFLQPVEDVREISGQQSHHRAARRVERACRGVRQPGLQRARCRRANLLCRRHGLDPGDVGSPGLQAFGQLAERLDGLRVVERSHRLEQLPRRAHRPGNDHRAGCRVGDLAGDLRGAPGQLEHAVLCVVQLETVPVAAERVGEDDVGAGIDELLMERAYLVGLVDVPELGRISGAQPPFEIVRTCCTVGKQRMTGRQQCSK